MSMTREDRERLREAVEMVSGYCNTLFAEHAQMRFALKCIRSMCDTDSEMVYPKPILGIIKNNCGSILDEQN